MTNEFKVTEKSMGEALGIFFAGLVMTMAALMGITMLLHKFGSGASFGVSMLLIAIMLAVIFIPMYLYMEADRVKNEAEWNERVAREKAELRKEQETKDLAYG